MKYRPYSLDEITNDSSLDHISGGDPTRILIICSLQRTGSYLLCRQLINAGVGVPQEYFNQRHRSALAHRWGIEDTGDEAYLDAVIKRRTTPNGVFAIKLQWKQFFRAKQPIEQHLFSRSPMVVFLTRRDLAAQAWSLHKAEVTGVWDGFAGQIKLENRTVALGDVTDMRRCFEALCKQETKWRRYLASRGSDFESLAYEDYVADQSGKNRRIMGLLDVRAPVPPAEPIVDDGEDPIRDAAISQLRRQIQAHLIGERIEAEPPNSLRERVVSLVFGR